MEARKGFASRIDIDAVLDEYKRLFVEDESGDSTSEEKAAEYVLLKEEHDDFVAKMREAVSDDLLLKIMGSMSATVRKRENTLNNLRNNELLYTLQSQCIKTCQRIHFSLFCRL